MDVDHELHTLQDSLRLALDHARALGASQAEASASVEEGLLLKVRQRRTDKAEFTRGLGLAITVYHGQAKGAASTSDLSPTAVRRAVEAAWAIARHTQPDEYAGLAEATQMATEFPDLGLYHPWALDVAAAEALALQGEEVALAHAGVDRCEAFSVASSHAMRGYANSHGVLAVMPSSRHSLGCSLIARDGDGQQRDSWGISARCASDLPPVDHVAAQAALRVTRRVGAQKLATGKLPVLFEAPLASGLFGHFLSAISGASLYRKSSFLVGSLGSQVFPAFLGLQEHPRLYKGYASAALDADGLPTRDKSFVSGGRVENYVLGTYSARRLGMASTANAGGVRNLRLQTDTVPLAQLLRDMGDGLLVTELMGQGVNLVTGDYSRGAAGFRVENGEITRPVHEFTIAGNLGGMFRNIAAIGDDIDERGNIHCGSVLVGEMMVGGR